MGKSQCITNALNKGMTSEQAHKACGAKVGDKIKSGGRGRGLGRGGGKGPIGRMRNA